MGGVVEKRIGLRTKVSEPTACYDLPFQLAETSLTPIDFFVVALIGIPSATTMPIRSSLILWIVLWTRRGRG
jgi:hypothetical protein